MNPFKELNVQAKIALIFAVVILVAIVGGIVNFLNLSSIVWALPGFNTAEKIGPGLYGALVRTSLIFAAILFIEVLLILLLVLWLMRTVSPLLKKAGEGVPVDNTSKPLPSGGDESATVPTLQEIIDFARQTAVAVRNANQVMAHSLVSITKGIAMSETTLEALKENRKLTFTMTQLIQKISLAFQKQPDNLH